MILSIKWLNKGDLGVILTNKGGEGVIERENSTKTTQITPNHTKSCKNSTFLFIFAPQSANMGEGGPFEREI